MSTVLPAVLQLVIDAIDAVDGYEVVNELQPLRSMRVGTVAVAPNGRRPRDEDRLAAGQSLELAIVVRSRHAGAHPFVELFTDEDTILQALQPPTRWRGTTIERVLHRQTVYLFADARLGTPAGAEIVVAVLYREPQP